ncbi:hypothetical protein N8I74_00065 [Chitiniphilus purpureus]|uniref:Lipoprotein n=1 Tax=Chitiniphilus purpureus TaxID=2981137 RepID=A0ABY6DM45_9NEIS|nr:hypothetical protein [Chitiniphilus sp. CD1]UXY15445.1 hypothetical protein N8I74_00065 [Chitiniphilus sp. CD1]
MKIMLCHLAAIAAMAAAGCSEQGTGPRPVQPADPTPVMDKPVADSWVGKWHGPEGTLLQLAGGNGTYQVTIQNLDGPRTFQGKAVVSGIAFERDGVKEVIQASNGEGTGMKWLAEKSNCLTVRSGEGYCRD